MTIYQLPIGREFKLVLSHERWQPSRADFLARHSPVNPLHHHGLASKLIGTLAGGVQKLADHTANFSLGSNAQKSQREVKSAAPWQPGK